MTVSRTDGGTAAASAALITPANVQRRKRGRYLKRLVKKSSASRSVAKLQWAHE